MQLWLDAWSEAARRPALQRVSRRLNREWQALVREIIERGVGARRVPTPPTPMRRHGGCCRCSTASPLQVVAHDALISRDEVVAWTRSAAAREVGIDTLKQHVASGE